MISISSEYATYGWPRRLKLCDMHAPSSFHRRKYLRELSINRFVKGPWLYSRRPPSEGTFVLGGKRSIDPHAVIYISCARNIHFGR